MAITSYQIADLLRTAVGISPKHRCTTAIIVAAGSSTRMGGKVSKQLLDVAGMPVLARTLEAYEQASTVDEIVLVARREDFDAFLALAKQYRITKLKRITEGGESRQASVLRGLEVVSDETKFVAIADGARCLVTPEMIDKVNLNAWQKGAACAGTKTTDTVKLVAPGDYAEYIAPDRETVWLAQTPQTFSLPLYRAAAYHAKEKGYTATDDAALVTAIGRPVKLVDCGKDNIKITTQGDLYLARAILAHREETDKEDNV
jgi:2-C-methyl-D-erythritol 4-phosphate cytidylyltransferase